MFQNRENGHFGGSFLPKSGFSVILPIPIGISGQGVKIGKIPLKSGKLAGMTDS